jgi:hypothetical protein
VVKTKRVFAVLMFSVIGLGFVAKLFESPLPPKCDKYFQAMESCMDAQKDVIAKADVESDINEKIKGVEHFKSEVRNKVSTLGKEKAAEYCDSPEFNKKTQETKPSFEDLVTMLTITKGMTDDCYEKIAKAAR